MLTEDQIDYLLQIRDTVPALPERTVRIMLGALRWSSEEIDRGIHFLKIPPASPEESAPVPIKEDKSLDPVLVEKPVVVKQNPFPIGSPLMKNAKQHGEIYKKEGHHFVVGAILGFLVIVVGTVLYTRL